MAEIARTLPVNGVIFRDRHAEPQRLSAPVLLLGVRTLGFQRYVSQMQHDAERDPPFATPRAVRASMRTIAVFEAAKGILVLLAAGIAVKFLHPDAQSAVEQFVAHFHLNPASRVPRIFLRAAAHITDMRLVLLAAGALAYAALRFAEAYGLWLERRWGWMLGIFSASVYLPFEVVESARDLDVAILKVLRNVGSGQFLSGHGGIPGKGMGRDWD